MLGLIEGHHVVGGLANGGQDATTFEREGAAEPPARYAGNNGTLEDRGSAVGVGVPHVPVGAAPLTCQTMLLRLWGCGLRTFFLAAALIWVRIVGRPCILSAPEPADPPRAGLVAWLDATLGFRRFPCA